VKAPGFDTDWEEDGERAWDTMNALTALSGQPDLDLRRVIVTGLSMGGEITTYVGALDPRVALAVPAGFSPDFGTELHHGNHPCWQWRYADIREYIDASDLHALTAPRALVVQTGLMDFTYSDFEAPFAADKQVARRSRSAFAGADALNFVHYLHYDAHHYHFGALNPTLGTAAVDVQTPALFGPTAAAIVTWQTDRGTLTEGATLFDFAHSALAGGGPLHVERPSMP
jgi:hypothetical protein